MRAIAVTQLRGQPQLMQLPEPTPKDDQLLVKVAFASMNPFDWKVADGIMEGVMPNVLPLVLGNDASGVVTAVGSAVSRFRLGDRVFGQFFHSPAGEGTYAEYALCPESGAVAQIPDGVADDVAAALPTAAMTALALVDLLTPVPGSKVLVVGATGGVGLFVLQLAAAKGLTVLASATAKDRDRALSFGASETFDYRQGDLAAQVSAAHPDGVDALIDLVDEAEAFAKLSHLVRDPGYALTTVGAADEKELQTRGVKGGNFYLQANATLLQRLATLVAQQRLIVPIETTVTLEETPAAIAAARRGGARGKTVIRM